MPFPADSETSQIPSGGLLSGVGEQDAISDQEPEEHSEDGPETP